MIRKTPGVCGGRACIRNTRIPVWTLVVYRQNGSDDASILNDYPTLTQSDLDTAWAYNALYAEEIQSDICDNEADD
ncbi:MAG TPA: DUF433 domain-containing protein [Stenomitos sp.]